jgi:hypothetical protein
MPMINESGLAPPFESVVACRPPGISRSRVLGVPLSAEPKRTLRPFLHGTAEILPLYMTVSWKSLNRRVGELELVIVPTEHALFALWFYSIG